MLDAIWRVSLDLAPWLLLGAALSGLLHIALPADFLHRHLRGKLGVLKAVLFGVPMPLCSCGVIPAGLGLRRDGASTGSAVGFLIATPQTGVDSIVVSASMLGWPFALFKVGAALITGAVGGLASDLWAGDDVRGGPADQTCEVAQAKDRSPRAALAHARMVLQSIWRWLLFGIIVSALIEVFVPKSVWTSVSSWSPALSMLAALAVSLPLYVCATASVPIAAALVAGGLPPGAALVFLMAGPATNVATIGAIRTGLGVRATVIYVVTVVVGSLGLGALFNGMLAGDLPAVEHAHHHTGSITVVLTLLFWGIMAWFALEELRPELRPWLSRLGRGPGGGVQAVEVNRDRAVSQAGLEVAVSGMTCQGCVRKLQRALDADADVNEALVTLEPQRARVLGPISEARLHQLVTEAGYQVVGRG